MRKANTDWKTLEGDIEYREVEGGFEARISFDQDLGYDGNIPARAQVLLGYLWQKSVATSTNVPGGYIAFDSLPDFDRKNKLVVQLRVDKG